MLVTRQIKMHPREQMLPKVTEHYIERDEGYVFRQTRWEARRYPLVTVDICFGRIILRTPAEEFYFVPSDGKVRLMHKNAYRNDGYHEQWRKRVTTEQILRYVEEHTEAKYTSKFVSFSVM